MPLSASVVKYITADRRSPRRHRACATRAPKASVPSGPPRLGVRVFGSAIAVSSAASISAAATPYFVGYWNNNGPCWILARNGSGENDPKRTWPLAQQALSDS